MSSSGASSVILPDVNVLLYAIDESSPDHVRARTWLEELLNGDVTVAWAWSVILAVIRLSTRPQIFAEPLAADEAVDLVAGWLARPNATIVDPTERHLDIMRRLLEAIGAAGNAASDAHLAALAIEHGAQLASADADFSRFPGLRRVNPLAA